LQREFDKPATFLQRAVVTFVSLAVVIWIYPGISVTDNNPVVIAVAALILTAANAVVRPLLIVLTLPLTCLTMGLFILVINGLMLRLTAFLMPDSFFVAGKGIVGALLVSCVGGLVLALVGRD
jgi:putative membrane protein